MDYLFKSQTIIGAYMLMHGILIIFYLKILNFFVNRNRHRERDDIKKISIIIPAYNEERYIYDKMINLHHALRYIDTPFEVLIGSDGSDDSTCQIVEDFIKQKKLINWKLFRFPNEGKCQTLNKLVKESKGNLIISTDVDITMDRKALQIIIKTFEEDKRIGCLSSIPVYQSDDMKSQSLYWNYEIKVRDIESQMGMLIVATGGLYAYRKELFKEIPHGVMADDLWIPLTILLKNYKSVHNIDLKVNLEETDEKIEVKRRKRVVMGGMDVIKRLFFNLIRNPILLFIVFSHKINKWLFPLWLILIIIGTLSMNLYYILAYGLIMIGLTISLSPKSMFFTIYSLISPVLSFNKLLYTSDISKWDHTRK